MVTGCGSRPRIEEYTFEDELFFKTSCITRITLSYCRFNPPNGAISWERLECLCLNLVTLDEDMIVKILSGSPCLKSLELKNCHGYKRIDVTSRSVKKLVFSDFYYLNEEEYRLYQNQCSLHIITNYKRCEKEVDRIEKQFDDSTTNLLFGLVSI
ncbi:thiamine thiazole synthase, chloroplastic-like protein [Tanacetum coccineum]